MIRSQVLEEDERQRASAVAALHTFLEPTSIAVVGASRTRGTPGGEVFHNLLAGEFAGPVYPVNPAAAVVQSVLAYPSVEAIPGPVDLAVIVVPRECVAAVAEECARKGVQALVVVSAGFAEVGAEGRARQEELLRICRQGGMRLIGPNCIGIANTDPNVRLNATFGPIRAPAGPVAFMSQSGALGLAAMDYAASRGIGISSFLSVGNKADISGNDALSYWESDPKTKVILLYLESFGNPRRFARVARRVGKTKPIAVVKSGRSVAGARATSSHTGAMLAASEITVDALFHQAGVIRTNTLEELFDVASLLANQPLPSGRGVGIVTNAGGLAILCADACEAAGLEIPILAAETQARLREFLPPVASVGNPVDMIASATPDSYGRAIHALAQDPRIHSIIALFISPLPTAWSKDVAREIAEATRSLDRTKPVLAVVMSSGGSPQELQTADVCVPSYEFPEAAAVALGHAARYAEWRRLPAPVLPRFADVRREEALDLVDHAERSADGWLSPRAVSALLACYGLPVVEQCFAGTPDEAAAAAAKLGGEVALKGYAPGLVHKSEAGLVRLDLDGADDVRAAARAMASAMAASGAASPEFVVQRMAPRGVEMIVGLVHDSRFGPVLACGAGGVQVELLKDIAVRLTPLTREDASEMLRSLKTYPLLTGFRGARSCDVAALEDVLLRVSAMAEDLPQILELDLNPVVALAAGAIILDARVRVDGGGVATSPP
ncbi:MAG TPA: acetate--CoA ligase family protein [Chloroflexota bacterium]|nr:acetate--CoA ligase family protein [Chloroflexota bacterium]